MRSGPVLLPGSRSGFQILFEPDPDPHLVSVPRTLSGPVPNQKKTAESALKVYLKKIVTKNNQKVKKATISY